MKNLKLIAGTALIVVTVSGTVAAKPGTIATTRTGLISTTRSGGTSTTAGATSSGRAGTISTTRTGLISTTRTGPAVGFDRTWLLELILSFYSRR